MASGAAGKAGNLARQSSYHPPLVISIHGIRTRGEWQKLFASALSASPIKVESFDYGHYGLIRFLTPSVNDRMVNKFYDWYASVVRSCPEVDLERYERRPSVVAHSLGSWIVGHALLKHADMRFDKMILAGSILPRDFDWLTLIGRDQVSFVRNECGQKDPWPPWAGRLVARAGTGGSEGFEWFGADVDNVKCEWFGHSDALMRQHIEKVWVPTLLRAPSPLAILHGRDIQDGDRFYDILDYSGAVIDAQAFGRLPHYGEVEISQDLSVKWVRVNPDIYTFLINRSTRKPAGYINAMPVEDDLYADIRSGRVTDNSVSDSGLVPFSGAGTVKIYLMSIAIAEEYRRWGDGIFQQAYVQLLNGFLEKLIYYAKNYGIRASHFLATAWTPEGRRMCQFFDMTEVGKDPFGDSIFELDLKALQSVPTRRFSPVLKRLLEVYKKLAD